MGMKKSRSPQQGSAVRSLNKQLRKRLYSGKGHTIALLSIALLTSFMYFFVSFSVDRNRSNELEYAARQHKEEFRFVLADPEKADTVIKRLQPGYDIEQRSIAKVVSGDRTFFIINRPRLLNLPNVTAGSLPEAPGEIAVQPKFLESNGLSVGSALELRGNEYRISGTFTLPDYEVFMPYGNPVQDSVSATFVIAADRTFSNRGDEVQTYYAGAAKRDARKSEIVQKVSEPAEDPAFAFWEKEPSSGLGFRQALESNAALARMFLLLFGAVQSFIFYLFFNRFMLLHREEFGSLLALGFTAKQIGAALIRFACAVSFAGGVAGLLFGFAASPLLNRLYEESYSFPVYEIGLNPGSAVSGLIIPMVLNAAVAAVAVLPVLRRDVYTLLHGFGARAARGIWKDATIRTTERLPARLRLPMRIALRKWSSVMLSGSAVFLMTLLFITGFALYRSSEIATQSQMEGNLYKYDISYSEPRTGTPENHSENMPYLASPAYLGGADGSRPIRLIGLGEGRLFTLNDADGHELSLADGAVISRAASWMYGIRIGDTLDMRVSGRARALTVRQISENGDPSAVYISRTRLADWMGVGRMQYSGVYSLEPPASSDTAYTGLAQKKAQLEQSAVSNRSSAVINQIAGMAVGCLLLYLVLLLHVQDSTSDMRTLARLGYQPKQIRHLLIDVYRPLLIGFYLLSLWPAIRLGESILRSTSAQTGDYIPFSVGIGTLLAVLFAILLLYQIMLALFGRLIQKETAQAQA